MKNYPGYLESWFKTLFSTEKRFIVKTLESIGCSNIEISRQYYYYYGWFTAPSGQEYYFCCRDKRDFKNDPLMYRTAKNRKDFTGGANQFIELKNLESIKL